jgi:hypothetical protein
MLLKADLLSVEYPLESCAMAAMSYSTTELSVRIEDLSVFGDAGKAEGKLNKCHGGTARESYYNIKFRVTVSCSLA